MIRYLMSIGERCTDLRVKLADVYSTNSNNANSPANAQTNALNTPHPAKLSQYSPLLLIH
jgi:hypothetical protein